ncbi:UDP-N-acetylglucosamine diphosphorylase 2-like [Gossypium australe]|uniref:UDP-N-acetylglucosamine diphosphorylase 2-like n=1 Tax=Gossypium australe TaxID=47621 RepID=A0A5B6UUP3_9ROSI|nr:UDP-N-acetylglucosamine diphosphorylase 2-like [Gossypium australe]
MQNVGIKDFCNNADACDCSIVVFIYHCRVMEFEVYGWECSKIKAGPDANGSLLSRDHKLSY